MTSSRAEEVAEVLWELKRADKISTFTEIARRAGFSAGSNGRTMLTCLKNVRHDWPHLQGWRAIPDTQLVEKGSEHEEKLCESGYKVEDADGDEVITVSAIEDHLMDWDAGKAEAAEGEEQAAAE
jgi:hypothetical protein